MISRRKEFDSRRSNKQQNNILTIIIMWAMKMFQRKSLMESMSLLTSLNVCFLLFWRERKFVLFAYWNASMRKILVTIWVKEKSPQNQEILVGIKVGQQHGNRNNIPKNTKASFYCFGNNNITVSLKGCNIF